MRILFESLGSRPISNHPQEYLTRIKSPTIEIGCNSPQKSMNNVAALKVMTYIFPSRLHFFFSEN